MIRIEFVGGAKKLFAAGTLDIDHQEISIGDLLEMLQGMRLEGTPYLDPRNMLVAINGSDTSVTGGMSSVARDGDTISIIPVIHGGAPTTKRIGFKIRGRRLELVAVAPDGPVGAAFLDEVRMRHPRLRLQAVSARFVLSETHAKKILALSVESDRLGILLANRIETDILMRFALTSQISVAIRDAGIGPSSRDIFILIAMGTARDLVLLHKDLEPLLTEPFASDRAPFLKRKFHITHRAIDATASSAPLEDILVERAAVLGASIRPPPSA